jgi:hypothetical protein
MPQEIRDVIHGDADNTLEDKEYRKRLPHKLGTRWLITQLGQAREGETETRAAPPPTRPSGLSNASGSAQAGRSGSADVVSHPGCCPATAPGEQWRNEK